MEIMQFVLTVILLAVFAEVTYLVVKLPRQNISRRQARPILVDTSVLIDGRIIAVAQSGFIGDTLVIPRSVIGELQFLADNADHDKRARARYGLDIVKELQSMTHLTVEILQDGSKAEEGVDERLLTLAKKHAAAICTIDYNLNKVAVVEGITVLNVNELAQSLRMAYLPGEKMLLEMVQKGQDAHQAVGYLTDGTMVVVEHANKSIGQTIEIEFIRSLQTAAGKMMFAKPVEAAAAQVKPQRASGKKPLRSSHEAARTVVKSTSSTPAPTPITPAPPVVAPEPVVFHSDANDRRHANKKPSTPRQQQPRRNSTNSATPNRQAAKKPRTSSQREAALIDLVENQ
jgi:rRNA-processing protein FCF1